MNLLTVRTCREPSAVFANLDIPAMGLNAYVRISLSLSVCLSVSLSLSLSVSE